jgi:hypothetical protein
VGSLLAHFELVLLYQLTLCLALIPESPIPRWWAGAAAILAAAQTTAVRQMRLAPMEPPGQRDSGLLHTTAELVALAVVPGLTALLIVAICVPLARANGRARRRLRAALARQARRQGAGATG